MSIYIYNEMSRRAIMDVIAEEPLLSHLEIFVAAIAVSFLTKVCK